MIKVIIDLKCAALQIDGKTPYTETVMKNNVAIETNEPVMLNKLIADRLWNNPKKNIDEDSRKLTDWAESLFKNEKLELDMSDTEKLRAIVKEEFNFSRGIEKRIFDIIDRAVEVAKKH